MACSSNFSVRISAFSGEILSSSDKSVPYISRKHVTDIALLNSMVQICGTSVVCTHLSALYISESIRCRNSNEKFRVYDLLGSAESIRRIAPSDIDNMLDRIVDKSSNKYIVVCGRFGHFLREIAINTSANSQRIFLLRSCVHAMALRVVCKLKTNRLGNSEYSYVVHLFDPNKTNVTARSEVSDPSFFLDEEKFSLCKFIGSDLYDQYFGKSDDIKEHELMIYECSDGDIRRRSECLSRLETLLYDGISECALYHLMESGLCSKNIIMMSKKLSLLPSRVRETVVFGRNGDGDSALYVALSNNNHLSIRAYCRLLDNLSVDEKVRVLPRLLIAGNKNGESGLIVAMQEDNAASICAFADLLNMLLSLRGVIPASRLADAIFNLLISKISSTEGGTGLFMAMQEGCSSAIVAFGSLLDGLISLSDEVPASDIARMVFAILKFDNGDANGLFMAMQEGHSSVITAFGNLLDRLVGLSDKVPALDIARMIFTILNSDGGDVTGLFMALQEGHSSTITAFGGLLDRLVGLSDTVPAMDIARMIFTILKSDSGGVTGLFMAMQDGCASAIDSFGGLLNRLVSVGNDIPKNDLETMLFNILLARSSGYGSGLFEAFKNNHTDVIRAYCSLLGVIDISRWPDLLDAVDISGITGILFTNEDTIELYLSILKEFEVGVLSKLRSRFENVKCTNRYARLSNSSSPYVVRYENFLMRLEDIIDLKVTTWAQSYKNYICLYIVITLLSAQIFGI